MKNIQVGRIETMGSLNRFTAQEIAEDPALSPEQKKELGRRALSDGSVIVIRVQQTDMDGCLTLCAVDLDDLQQISHTCGYAIQKVAESSMRELKKVAAVAS